MAQANTKALQRSDEEKADEEKTKKDSDHKCLTPAIRPARLRHVPFTMKDILQIHNINA
jgi:hypothetical protein